MKKDVVLLYFYTWMSCSFSGVLGNTNETISTQDGLLKGSRDPNGIYSFLGVRYAEKPGRFEAPVRTKPWSGTRDALRYAKMCVQSEFPNPKESEDCLFLNVITPSLNSSHPVLFYIHGGGFTHGKAKSAGGKSLAKQGIVSVYITYRLGALGFLSSGDHHMSGNYGLLDQLEALRWVHRNIHYFGGDPNHITIAGQSAGSASTSLHIVSPLSNGLFKRAVMFSGFSLNIWACELPSRQNQFPEVFKNISEYVGCNQTNTADKIKCLKTTSLDKIMKASFVIRNRIEDDMVYVPRVDGNFLKDYPLNVMKSGSFNKVDTIRGYNSGEFSKHIKDPEDDGVTRSEFLKHLYYMSSAVIMKQRKEFVANVTRLYLGTLTNPFAIRERLVETTTDLFFALGALLELNLTLSSAQNTNNHYLYRFDYRGSSENISKWEKEVHGAQGKYFFNMTKALTSQSDRIVSEKLITSLGNFIKTGNPLIKLKSGYIFNWEKVAKSKLDMLNIDNHFTMSNYPRKEMIVPFFKMMEGFLSV